MRNDLIGAVRRAAGAQVRTDGHEAGLLDRRVAVAPLPAHQGSALEGLQIDNRVWAGGKNLRGAGNVRGHRRHLLTLRHGWLSLQRGRRRAGHPTRRPTRPRRPAWTVPGLHQPRMRRSPRPPRRRAPRGRWACRPAAARPAPGAARTGARARPGPRSPCLAGGKAPPSVPYRLLPARSRPARGPGATGASALRRRPRRRPPATPPVRWRSRRPCRRPTVPPHGSALGLRWSRTGCALPRATRTRPGRGSRRWCRSLRPPRRRR